MLGSIPALLLDSHLSQQVGILGGALRHSQNTRAGSTSCSQPALPSFLSPSLLPCVLKVLGSLASPVVPTPVTKPSLTPE